MTKAEDWYYGSEADGQRGPFSREQMSALLQAGVLNATTLLWNPTLPNWIPLGQSALAAEMPVPTERLPAVTISIEEGRPVNGFAEAVSTCFRSYATFKGRGNRPEFWYFMLFIMIAGIGTAIADVVLFGGEISPLNAIFSLGIILPELAAMVRRLHDTDRSGWWLLLILVPLAGFIALIVFWCQRGTPGRNRFG